MRNFLYISVYINGAGTTGRDLLKSLFDSEYKGLCAYAYKMIRNREMAEDIVQNAFMKIFEKLEKIENQKAYLYRIVLNEIRSDMRRKKNTVSLDEIHDMIPDEKNSGSDDKLLLEKLEQSVLRLSVADQELINLFRIHGMEEISKIKGIHISTVYRQMEKIEDKLKKMLGVIA